MSSWQGKLLGCMDSLNVAETDGRWSPSEGRVSPAPGDHPRKHSNSDLQSRLKTRKLLGVGELVGDNGDIYRSKISQILGINENLYVKLPRGLLVWHTLNAIYLYGMGILCVVLPRLALAFELPTIDSPDPTIVRMYGVSLISFAVLFRGLLVAREGRNEISAVLLSCAVLFGLQLLVNLSSGGFSGCRAAIIVFRILGLIGNLCYQSIIDAQGGVFRSIHRLSTSIVGASCSSSSDEKDKTI